MADVFISYKKEDRELAERVEKALNGAGYTSWWDNAIHPRESWDAIIEREIEAASAIVVIWTPRSVKSEWVKIEANYAKTRGKLVPLMAETCTIPLAVSLTQAAMLTDWNGSGEHEEWNKALGWIEALMGGTSQAPDEETRKQWELEAAVAILTGLPIPAERLPHLRELSISDWDDELFKALKYAGVPLQDVYVDPDSGRLFRELKFADVSALAALTELQALTLSCTKVADISALAALKELQALSLSRTQVSDITALSALTGLQSLNLYGTQVSNISALSALTGLQTLDLRVTQVSDITALSALKRLTSLGLWGAQVVDWSPVDHVYDVIGRPDDWPRKPRG